MIYDIGKDYIDYKLRKNDILYRFIIFIYIYIYIYNLNIILKAFLQLSN